MSVNVKPSLDKGEDGSQGHPNGNAVISADLDEANFSEMLDALPQEHRGRFLEMIHEESRHSGWLPTPDFLRQYEAILPGLAERIVAMPEREQAHRHRTVEEVVKSDKSLKRRGQTFALISLVLLVGLAAALIYLGQYAWGSRIAMFGVVGVVGIFVTGKWFDRSAMKSEDGDDSSD